MGWRSLGGAALAQAWRVRAAITAPGSLVLPRTRGRTALPEDRRGEVPAMAPGPQEVKSKKNGASQCSGRSPYPTLVAGVLGRC